MRQNQARSPRSPAATPLSLARRELGCHPLRRLHPASPQVWLVRHQGRLLVAKFRHRHSYRRLDKEADWLRQARSLGIAAPHPVLRCDGPHVSALLMTHCHDHRTVSLQEHLQQLQPLHALPGNGHGWGPLRADRRPRWSEDDQALAWYQQYCPPTLLDELVHTWKHRCAGIIHGDLHRRNTCGSHILDWETVAVADPWEDLCRAVLAQGWSTAPAWTGIDHSLARWRGAWLRSCIESAAFPGPRQRSARLWLLHSDQ